MRKRTRRDREQTLCAPTKAVSMAQVSRMISGAPVSICITAKAAAKIVCRPPSFHARSTCNTTQGIQPNAAMLFGHIKQFNVRPLKANIIPATVAAKRLRVNRIAGKYIPRPESN